MISGETEAIFANFYDDYDHFLFFGKRRKGGRSAEDKTSRRAKRKKFWTSLGRKVKEGGGAEGIGKTVDNILGLFAKQKEGEPVDYEIDVLPNPKNEAEQSSSVPAGVWIAGGIIIVGFIAWRYAKPGGSTKSMAPK